MWWLTRSLLYAGAFSCALHILLLGLAASVSVALPAHPVTPVRVTLVQRAVPLPVQDLPKGDEEAKAAPVPPQPPPPELPRPKRVPPRPVTEKKPEPRIPPRPPKPIVKPQRIPPPEPPPEVKEEPAQVALTTPPPPEVAVQEQGPVTGDEQTIAESENQHNADAHAGSGADGAARVAGGTGGSAGGTAGMGGLSATPDYNVNPKPPYPLLARRIGAQGEVLLRVLVRQDGSVATVELARSSGFSLLDESATRTVRDNWRFIPARLDGAPVESWVEVPIKFVLADS